MSKQNRKKRVRARMAATGSSYTRALRDQQKRDNVGPEPGGEDEFARMARETCNECGGEVRWTDPAQIANLDRQRWMELKAALGVRSLLDGSAWVCLQCDNFGFFPADMGGAWMTFADLDSDLEEE